MKNIKRLIFFILALSIQACFPADEDPVKVAPISGAILSPQVGGAAQPNQVWIKLSDSTKSVNKRTDWDLAFYSGDEYRVILNFSVMMGAGKIQNVTDIDAVKMSDVEDLMNKIYIAPQEPDTEKYIDDPAGHYLSQKTGIQEIKENNEENPIYLINMGRDIYTGTILPGSSISGGESRGWKKIQIVRNGNNGYKIKYANIGETDHKEFIITKDADYHFQFFSMTSGKTVSIQPKKKNWDIAFTIFTNYGYDTSGVFQGGTYIYNDFVLINIFSNVGAYQVNIPNGQNQNDIYNQFKLNDVDVSKFIFNDQRAIGDHWRTVTGNNGAQVFADRFYVIKDADGFFFKLRFSKMMKDGIRGHPEFEYEPL